MSITFSGCSLLAVPNPTDFKFKKGDKVHVKFTEMFSACFGSNSFNADPGICSEVTDSRKHLDGKNQYKLKGFTGWWDEVTLVAIQN